MTVEMQKTRREWCEWLKGFTNTQLFDAIMRNCQGAESTCQHCGEKIYFDIIEGGGIPDWGTKYGNYGCSAAPETCHFNQEGKCTRRDEAHFHTDGCGGHLPVGVNPPPML